MRESRPGSRLVAVSASAAALLLAGACSRAPAPTPPAAIRLVNLFTAESLQGAAPAATTSLPRIEWRFDRPAEAPREPGAAPAGPQAGRNIADLAVRDARLTGRTTSDFPILHVARTQQPDSRDQLQAIELRLRVSAGANLSISIRGDAPPDFAEVERSGRSSPFGWISSPVVPGDALQTYTLTSPMPVNMTRVRRILIRPTDAAGATFAIESIRVVTRREHLASIASGVSWQGLNEVYRESLVSRAPEVMRFTVALPERPWLDLAIGTVDDHPATFRVAVKPDGADDAEARNLLDQSVSTPYRWERRPIDLSEYGGRTVVLSLSVAGSEQGLPALWGSPVVRSRWTAQSDAPQGVILVHADTLRPDHLGLYAHTRDTAPFLSRLAAEGAVFKHAYAQAGWTKVSSSSILTSLYPSTHGVFTQDDRLPASATTIAEVYRAAGYATLSLSSVTFTGQYTNLHQGFEELHEVGSLTDAAGAYSSKTAREYVDRASDWIDRHKDAPFFLYLHVFDPHSPYEPRRPYDTLWADPAKREQHIAHREALRKTIENPFLAGRGMATPGEMLKAGIDPAAYIAHDKDWYDSSIRALDVELARLFERLRGAGVDGNTAVVFLSDHGEEFHEHGRMWHGQSTYGEMVRVPLVVRWPGRVPPGQVIDEPVQLLDVMPTLLDFSGLEHPKGIQGQSLVPLVRPAASTNGDPAGNGWRRRPVVIEKQPMGGTSHPEISESYAIVDGQWKLIRNKLRPPDKPEFELYDATSDPLDRHDVASQHADVVQRLAKALDGWHAMASGARLKPDAEDTKSLTPEQLQRLRSLGYIK